MKPLAEIKINGKKIEIDYTQNGLLVAIRLGRILHPVTFFVPGLVCAGKNTPFHFRNNPKVWVWLTSHFWKFQKLVF